MRLRAFILIATLTLVLTLSAYVSAHEDEESPFIKAGDKFPAVKLNTPAEADDLKYLGLKDGRTFAISDIQAPVALVEILNVYCGSCQAQAPYYNKLYRLIEEDPQTRGKIKIIGVAVGNGDYEVAKFREKFKAPFPIIPDPYFLMYHAVGETPTPFSIYTRLDPESGRAVVVKTHLGVDSDHEKVYAELKKAAETEISYEAKEREAAGGVVELPAMNEKELLEEAGKAIVKAAEGDVAVKAVTLGNGRTVYEGVAKERGAKYFAMVIERPVPCDQCHDVRFVYVIDENGEVTAFHPTQTSKLGNEPWDEEDIRKFSARVVGRKLNGPWPFDPGVDAVSSATISSAVIFDALAQEGNLIGQLKAEGLL